jgi:hypothetical protein
LIYSDKEFFMLLRFFTIISFGNQYAIAMFAYVGLGMILMAITPDLPFSFAIDGIGCGGEATCPQGQSCYNGECCSSIGQAEGKKCCKGEWIPASERCCGDGSHGNCGCCGEDNDSFAIIPEEGTDCLTEQKSP